MKVGDKVKVKAASEIKALLNSRNNSSRSGLRLFPVMETSCGQTLTVTETASNWVCLSDNYYYDFDWISLVPPDNIWNDGSIEQRSLNLALLRQTQAGNTPSIYKLLSYDDLAFPPVSQLGFNCTFFPKDDWSGRIALNIPDWKWLNLNPEIVERALAHMKIQKASLCAPEEYSDNIALWFFFPTEEFEYWSTIRKELLDNNHKQTKEYEIKLQEERASFTGDCGQAANRICYRKSKAQFVIRHTSYKGSPFRC